jgi:hypothetical protein
LGTKLLKSLKNKAAVSENKRKMVKQVNIHQEYDVNSVLIPFLALEQNFYHYSVVFRHACDGGAWTICELIYSPLSAVLTLSLAAIFNVATNAVLSQVFNTAKSGDKTDDLALTEPKKSLAQS